MCDLRQTVTETFADTRTWVPGQRLFARQRPWTLLGTESGLDCTALYLWSDVEATVRRALIAPFDRFKRRDERGVPAVLRIRRWIHVLRALAVQCRPAGSLHAAASSHIRLLPYQLEPALAVVRQGVARVLIADAVGLGKTIQAGLIAAELLARAPSLRVLILVPAGLRDQWEQELTGHFGLRCLQAHAAWLRQMSDDHPTGLNPWTLPGVYLASLDFVKQAEVLRPLEDVTWDLVVVDEAHTASSRSDRRAAAHAIATRSKRVVLLTATPHSDDALEYEALCGIGRLDRSESPPLLFRRSRRDVGEGSSRRSTLMKVRPTDAENRMHELLEEYTRQVWRESSARGDPLARLAAIVLRKRALSSASSLAASIRKRRELLIAPAPADSSQLLLPLGDEDPLDDGAPGEALGTPGLSDSAREHRWLALVGEAAQRAAASESKIRFLRRFLSRSREPAIVFTEYRDTLLRLRRALMGSVRTLLVLHGGMSPAERSSVQRAFNESTAVLLATDAAAEGLNLHNRCRTVLHFELPWSTARLEQRAGRVDRFGQVRRVHELALVSETSAERLVLGPLMRRAAQVQLVDEHSGGLPAVLTESHVAEVILGGPAGSRAVASIRRIDDFIETARATGFQQEADTEVRRATELRRLIEAPFHVAPRPSLRRSVAASLRCRASELPEGLILIYALALSGPVQGTFHEQVVVLCVPLRRRWLRPCNARRLRELVQSVASDVRVNGAVQHQVHEVLNTALPVQTQVNERQSGREQLMNRARESAARQLVQGGLFERRTQRAKSAQPAATVPDTARSEHLRPGARNVAGVETRLVAALLVHRR